MNLNTVTNTNPNFDVAVLNRLKHKTPFMLIDCDVVKNKYLTFKKVLPDVKIHYAVKSNPDVRIIKTLKQLGSGFEIASVGELDRLLQQGVSIKDIIYSNPVKPIEHIRGSYKAGIRHFAFDSIQELDKLAKHAPDSFVYYRLKVSDYGSSFPLSAKFGGPSDRAVLMMGYAQDLGLKPWGITFHVGSQSEREQAWEVAIETCGKVLKMLQKAGIKLEVVNLGGGFPAKYVERIPTINKIATVIKRSISKNFPYNVKLISEPGRYLVAESAIFATSVIGRGQRAASEWVFVDMGVFQGLIEVLEINGWKYPLYSSIDSGVKNKSKRPFTLTGPSCDAGDTICTEAYLPASINIGDRVYIGSAGAYTKVYATTFNGFKAPETYYCKKSGK